MKRVLRSLLIVWVTGGVIAAAPAIGAELLHEVRAGESASSIARHYYGGFEFTDLLLRYNKKEGPVIRPGERLRVPFCDVHVVRTGDTWSEIAQRYLGRASDYEVIASMNGLGPQEPLRVGQRIQVPVFVSHTLERGETLALLAERFYGDADRAELLRHYNRIDDPRRLALGQQIRIPLIMLRREAPADSTPARQEEASAQPTRGSRTEEEQRAEPVNPTHSVRPTRRFAAPLGAARRAYLAGEYEKALSALESLIERIERQGTAVDRTELWALLAFV